MSGNTHTNHETEPISLFEAQIMSFSFRMMCEVSTEVDVLRLTDVHIR